MQIIDIKILDNENESEEIKTRKRKSHKQEFFEYDIKNKKFIRKQRKNSKWQ